LTEQRIPQAEVEQDHPHACWDGWVYLGYTDPETDEERTERLPCRRCASEAAALRHTATSQR
jgi:hypothetical protein